MGLSAFLPYVLLWHPMSTARKSPPILPPASQYIHRPGCPRCFEQHGALLVHRQGRQPVLLGRRPRRQNRGSEKYLISWHMRARRLEGFGGNSTLHHLLLLPDGRILAKYHHESLGQLDGGITMHCSSSLTALTCDPAIQEMGTLLPTSGRNQQRHQRHQQPSNKQQPTQQVLIYWPLET